MSKEEDWKELEKWQKEDNIKKDVNKVKMFNEEDYKGVQKLSNALDSFIKIISTIAIVIGIIACIFVVFKVYSIVSSESFFNIRVQKGGMF